MLASLADLAVDGDAEALQRLIELTPAAVAAPAPVDALASLWEEVARNAPDETLSALRAAPAAPGEAALGIIASGVARADEPDHPLHAALRRAQSGSDADLAAFARTLGPRFEEQLSAARALLKAPAAPTIGPAKAPAATSGKPAAKTDS